MDTISEILTEPVCPFCSEAPQLEILEYYPEDRAFTIDTCCETFQNIALDEMREWNRSQWKAFLSENIGQHTRGACVDDVDGWTIDYGLEFCPVPWQDAKMFIASHHRHNKPPVGWKFGAGLRLITGDGSPGELIAVLMVGRPGARRLQERGYLEITRLCVKPIFPAGLAWNACSQLYGYASKEASRRGVANITSYTLAPTLKHATHLTRRAYNERLLRAIEEGRNDLLEGGETGISLRAAGFKPVAVTKGGTWHRSSRPRTDKAPTCAKIRWERTLKPARTSTSASQERCEPRYYCAGLL